MRSLRYLTVIILLIFSCAITAEAATFAYIKVSGRTKKIVQKEQIAIEKKIQEFKNGQILLKQAVSNGIVIRRHTLLILFAGEKRDVENFLKNVPYEGDVLNKLCAKVLFNFDTVIKNQDEKNKVSGKGNLIQGMVPRLTDPRPFLKLLSSKAPLMEVFKATNKIVNGNSALKLTNYERLSNTRASVRIFANSIRPENFLLEWKGRGYSRENQLSMPSAWESMKDYTAEESKEFIEKIDL